MLSPLSTQAAAQVRRDLISSVTTVWDKVTKVNCKGHKRSLELQEQPNVGESSQEKLWEAETIDANLKCVDVAREIGVMLQQM